MVPATSQPTPPYQIRHLQEQGVPVAFCHRSVPGTTAPTLKIDFKEVGRMTIQKTKGSDYFTGLEFARTDDLGKTWSKPSVLLLLLSGIGSLFLVRRR